MLFRSHENAPRRTFRDVWVNITDFGMIKCVANNGVGNGTDELSVMVIPTGEQPSAFSNFEFLITTMQLSSVSDFPDSRSTGFEIIGTPEPIETDDVEYNCAVTRINSTNNGKLYYVNASQPDGPRIPIENVPGITVTDSSTKWSYQKKFTIRNIQLYHSGEFICLVDHSNGEEASMEKTINLRVQGTCEMHSPVPWLINPHLNLIDIAPESDISTFPILCSSAKASYQ